MKKIIVLVIFISITGMFLSEKLKIKEPAQHYMFTSFLSNDLGFKNDLGVAD